MSDLASWLLEQIAEDERLIRAEDERLNSLLPAAWVIPDIMLVGNPGDTERMLAECAAKRAIIALHDGNHKCSESDDECTWIDGRPCETLLLLARPYAYRPGYLEEWRP